MVNLVDKKTISEPVYLTHSPNSWPGRGYEVTFLKNSDKELVFLGLPLPLGKGGPCFSCPPGESCWMATCPGTCKVVPVTCWELKFPARAWALRGCMEPVTADACPPTLTWTGKKVIPPFSLAIPVVWYKEKSTKEMLIIQGSPGSVSSSSPS